MALVNVCLHYGSRWYNLQLFLLPCRCTRGRCSISKRTMSFLCSVARFPNVQCLSFAALLDFQTYNVFPLQRCSISKRTMSFLCS
ncbi:hypothetical protein SK128_015941, partial [Halocaridina rubra]